MTPQLIHAFGCLSALAGLPIPRSSNGDEAGSESFNPTTLAGSGQI